MKTDFDEVRVQVWKQVWGKTVSETYTQTKVSPMDILGVQLSHEIRVHVFSQANDKKTRRQDSEN